MGINISDLSLSKQCNKFTALLTCKKVHIFFDAVFRRIFII